MVLGALLVGFLHQDYHVAPKLILVTTAVYPWVWGPYLIVSLLVDSTWGDTMLGVWWYAAILWHLNIIARALLILGVDSAAQATVFAVQFFLVTTLPALYLPETR